MRRLWRGAVLVLWLAAGCARAPSRARAGWRGASVLVFVLLLSACGGGAATISEYGLYVIDLGEGTATALIEGTAYSSVDVSPEGSRMVYSGDNEYPGVESADVSHSGFFVAGVDGSDPVLLTDEWVWRRMWFPDGSGVLYTLEQDGLFAFSMGDYSSIKLSDHRPAVVVFSEGGNVLHGNDDGLFVSSVGGSAERRLASFASDDEEYGWRINRRHEWRGWGVYPEAATHVAFNAGNRLMLAGIDDPEDSRRLTGAPYRDF